MMAAYFWVRYIACHFNVDTTPGLLEAVPSDPSGFPRWPKGKDTANEALQHAWLHR